MKTVFSKTVDVCRLWAAQSQDEARTGSNTSFRGDTLRSYGTPIARLVPNAAGKRVALVSSRQWSSGTSKVQGEAAAEASKALIAVFRVPDLSGELMHGANLQHYADRADEALDKLLAGRVTSAKSYRGQAKAIIATAANYAATFGVTWAWTGRDPDAVRHEKEEG